ncbi:glycosyl hydrolase family 28-related protein [Paraburkholderia sp. JHI869]|uniref:glycosyl hydrolase family 28-related protein n=1 Tax=Paraburkholderia sp. JHI869 TaxID=3112959 RepID=UPI003177CFBD
MSATVVSAPMPILQFFNNAGQPNSGGTVLTQVNGVNYATYQDAAGNTPLPNPIPLNSRGEVSNTSGISCQLFLVAGETYTFTQFDANGNQINQATAVAGSPGLGVITDAYVAANAAINASKLAFTQLGTGAVQRTVLSKLQDFISCTDFGTAGDGVTDDTAAMQAAFNAANLLGKELYIPAGTYILSSGISIDNSAQSTFPVKRISIRGDGAASTNLFFTNSASLGISIKNSSSVQTSLQKIQGIAISSSLRAGFGLYLLQMAHVDLSDLWVSGFNIAIVYQDVQESVQTNVDCQWNNGGFYCSEGNSTEPNALLFQDCTYGNNANYGIDAQNVATFVYVGGSIEWNNSSSYSTIWGCRLNMNSNAAQGTAAASFLGAYIESNGSPSAGVGQADIWYVNDAVPSTLVVQGCSFQRHANYSINNIRIDTSGGNRHKVVLQGNGHKGWPDYTASSSRPYIQVVSATDPVQLVDLSNYYDNSVEAPNYSGSVAMPASPVVAPAVPVAWVRFNGNTAAIAQSFNVSSITRNSPGNYTVNYARGLQQSTNCYSIATNGAGFNSVINENSTGVNIGTTNTSNTAQDFSSISVVVLGGNLT